MKLVILWLLTAALFDFFPFQAVVPENIKNYTGIEDVASTSISTSTSIVTVKVTDFVTGKSVPATVTVWKHEVLATLQGLFIGGIGKTIRQNDTRGETQFSLAMNSWDYAGVTVKANGYRNANAILISPTEMARGAITIQLYPLGAYSVPVEKGNARWALEKAHYDKKKEGIDWKLVVPKDFPKLCKTNQINLSSYAEVHGLKYGYNGNEQKTSYPPASIRRIWIARELFLAGVLECELALFTTTATALDAQVIAARTFAWYNRALRRPQSWQHAFDRVITTESLASAERTSGKVLRYKGAIIRAQYAARCNGNRTFVTESKEPYLCSVKCSGHDDCKEYAEKFGLYERCHQTPSGWVFGWQHGLGGMCQRGCVEWGEKYDKNGSWILDHYYPGTTLGMLE